MRLYLTIPQALSRYPVTEAELVQLIDDGQIKAVYLESDDGNRELVVHDGDLNDYVADRDITPDKFDHLRGNLLGMTEAGMKYGIYPSNITRWVKQGILEIKGTDGKKKLVDEADVARLAKLAEAKGMRQGKGLI